MDADFFFERTEQDTFTELVRGILFYTPFRKVAVVILKTVYSCHKGTMQEEEEAPVTQQKGW